MPEIAEIPALPLYAESEHKEQLPVMRVVKMATTLINDGPGPISLFHCVLAMCFL